MIWGCIYDNDLSFGHEMCVFAFSEYVSQSELKLVERQWKYSKIY